MEREILYRGKRVDSGEWVYGFYWLDLWVDGKPAHIINAEDYLVAPDTVGEYTGLTDKNGVKIFQGDILIFVDPDSGEYDDNERFVVRWDEESVGFLTEIFHRGKSQGLDELLRSQSVDYEVIGNIHDNPKLLEGGSEA